MEKDPLAMTESVDPVVARPHEHVPVADHSVLGRVFLATLVLLQCACGAGGGGGSRTTITITNKITTLPAGRYYQFLIDEQHSHGAGFDLMLTGEGTLVSYGPGALYIAPPSVPASNSITVTATAANDPSASDSATFAITPAPGPVVSLSPSTITVTAGGSSVMLNISVTDDDSSDVLMVGVSGSPDCGGACGSFGAIHGAPGGGSYTVEYFPPAAVTEATEQQIQVLSNLANSTPGITIATIDPVLAPLEGSPPQSTAPGALPSTLPAGRSATFNAVTTNLVASDTSEIMDLFVDHPDTAHFTSLCDPRAVGMISCPCQSAPSGPDRGCDNSSTTGGASLSASGVASVRTDSLMFTTRGEKPTATSVLLQGTEPADHGIVYGQGVRCVGGTLERLFVKTAVAGSITAPDFGVGDPTVSARSAALGDVIHPGQSRWYLVYYRDPIVLGGCPASSTFNATQTGRVDWSP
jgi:hypothetical protein